MAIQFSPAHCQLIAQKRKTQTRRLLKPGKPCHYKVGSTHSVQPGRGKFTAQVHLHPLLIIYPKTRDEAISNSTTSFPLMDLLIDVTAVRSEPLHNMTEADAHAEGYASVAEYAQEWNRLHTKRGTRWADNPIVWVIDFE